MQITALRAQLADLEEENLGLKEKIRTEVRDEYESLVWNLFVTCVHLNVGTEEEGLLNQSFLCCCIICQQV